MIRLIKICYRLHCEKLVHEEKDKEIFKKIFNY